MARKKKLTLEEELIELKDEIERCEAEIQRLTGRQKELKQLIEQKQMEALHRAVLESGKTIDEAISLISSNSNQCHLV